MRMLGEKHEWPDYQSLMAEEKKVSRRLLDMLSEKYASLEETKKNTYREYISKHGHLGNDWSNERA